MPDITTTKGELVLTAAYEDGREEAIMLENPRNDITAADIASVAASARDALIGFVDFRAARAYTVTNTKLDLS